MIAQAIVCPTCVPDGLMPEVVAVIFSVLPGGPANAMLLPGCSVAGAPLTERSTIVKVLF